MFSTSKTQINTLVAMVVTLACSPAAFSQTTDIRDPLIFGTPTEAPGVPAQPQQPPALGAPLPANGVNPGMPLPSTLLPSVLNVPSNDIDVQNSNIGLPFSPATLSQPGQLGQQLGGAIPPPPSNPGPFSGTPGVNNSLYLPQFSGEGNTTFTNPATTQVVAPQGGLPGVGGFNGSIPNTRRSGQTTQQFELRGRNVQFGQGSGAVGGIQDEVTRLGPVSGNGMPYGVPTGTFDKTTGTANVRNSAIDLGGGARTRTGGPNGTTVSNGSTVGDYGLSVTRNGFNSAGISAQQAVDFGQGRRNQTNINSNNTTDFGLGFRQFNQVNETAQKTGQLLQPSAVITNF